MNADLKVTLCLTMHANAALAGHPCSCALKGRDGSPLTSLGTFQAEGVPSIEDPAVWLRSLQDQGARRLWINAFQSPQGGTGWAFEVELSEGAEVWLARGRGPIVDFERVISRIPLSPRTPQLEQAHQRLKVALSETHRQAIEARDAPLAAELLEARDCLAGTGAFSAALHELPDQGYGPDARALYLGAQRVDAIPSTVGEVEEQLRQAVLSAALTAANSPLVA
jgi:hypothetical protein